MPGYQSVDFVLVENLDSINRSLKLSGPLVAKAMQAGMVQGAEPIRAEASQLAESEISGMKRSKTKPPPWSIQRVGHTIHEVYIAPRERGVKSKTDRSRRRPTFTGLMFGKSYNPALERGRPALIATVDSWLDEVTGTI